MNPFITEDLPVNYEEEKEQLFRDALTASIIAAEFDRYMNGESSYFIDAGIKEGFPEIVVRNSFMIMGNGGLQQAMAFSRCFEYFGVSEEFNDFVNNETLLNSVLELLAEDFVDMLAAQFSPEVEGNHRFS